MTSRDDALTDVAHTAPDENGAAAPHRHVERLLVGPIGGTLWRLSAPNIIGFVVYSGVAVAEMWYVGQLGTRALAGLALGFPMFMLMQMLSAGAVGGAIAAAVARALGAGDRDRAEALAWHALIIALAAGGLFTLIFLALGSPIYGQLGGRGDTLRAALAYSDVVFAGCVVIWLFNALGSLLRGIGDMKTPALTMLLTAALQVPLSGALSLGWGPFPRLGIAGVAWGAVLALAVATVVLAIRLGAEGGALRLRPSALRPSRAHFADILRVGLVASISPFLSVAAVILMTGLVSRHGDAALAGFGIGARLEFLLIPVIFGIGAAMIAMVGASVGAGDLDRAHRIGWTGGTAAAVIAGGIGLTTAIWPEVWAGLFTDDGAVFATAAAYLAIVAPFYAFQGLGLSLYFASQGAGAVLWPVLAGAGRLLVAIGGGGLAMFWFDAGFERLLAFVAAGMVVYGLGTAAAIALGAWRRPA
ncbi:MAG: MATE family efflux transporter [Alphaproteobacteria bacterium]|jgi:putative MATE family efflux protein|nr:MATE family efflux transporter [Alphaproteobacteria bacterium]